MMKLTVLRPREILALGFVAFGLLVACSKQDEGERCSTENGDNDCESSLICVPASDLRDNVDRCCPPEGSPVSDGRCTRLIGGGNGNGEGGEGGEPPTTSSSTTAGKSCSYNSDCPEGLVCGPAGECQAECRDARDCPPEYVCSSAQRCVPEGS